MHGNNLVGNTMNNLSALTNIVSIAFNIDKQSFRFERRFCFEKDWLCMATNTHNVYIPLALTPHEKPIVIDGSCRITNNIKTFIHVWLSMFGIDDYKRIVLSWRLSINAYSIYAELHDTTSPILIGNFRVNAPFHSSDCIASNYETLYDVIM